jgi:3-polyprenyl-4-hydroxybenzoate decarboxylase
MTPASLSGRKILLIVGGGIAAYKALELVRLLRKAGAEVMSVLTAAGAEFVTPMSLAALTGHPVRQKLFLPDDETAMGHIELSRWADLVVVAPATAGLIAKAANGLADDLASTTLLATDKRVLLAPAMNVRMWLHPAVQANMARLKAFDGFHGVAVVGPGRWRNGLRRVRPRAHGRAGGDPDCHRRSAGRSGWTSPGRASGRGHRRSDLRADRSCARPDQSLQRQNRAMPLPKPSPDWGRR